MNRRSTPCLAILITLGTVSLAGAPVHASPDTPDVAARVGDRTITRAELDREVRRAINSGYFHRNLPEETLEALRREQLQELIRRQLDILGARDRGLEPDLEEARRQRAAVEARLGKELYEQSLAVNGWTREDHVRVLAETLMGLEAHRRFVTEKAGVDEQDVKEAYEADPDRWTMPPSVHLRHILLKVAPGATPERWTAREMEALALADRARRGESFADLAAEHSEGMYRIKGGDLGWVHRGRLQPELEQAAWDAEPGTVVGPIRTAEGVHLLLVEERRGKRKLTFAEAAPLIRKQLEQQALQRAEREWYDAVRARHPVEIPDPDLRPVEGEE